MSLCRFLPTPSDRMGILWSLLGIEGSVVLEYGPAGTTHYAVEFFSELNLTQENRLFTTHMNEDDVIMGDVSRLEDGICEIDETFKPQIIFVVASSVSSVIGTDIKGVCRYMQDKVSAKLIALEEGGFKGDYSSGEREITKLVVKSLVEETPKAPKTFNILGASSNSYRITSDINELSRLMNEAFDYTLHTSLFDGTSIKEIEEMSKVEINVVISEMGLETAKFMEEKFGIPYIYQRPYGYKDTLSWLENISKVINVEISPKLHREIAEKIRSTMHYARMMMMFKIVSPKAYIYADYDTAKGIKSFISSFGANVTLECKHSLKGLESDEISYYKTEKERIDVLKSLEKTFVMADDVSNGLVNDTNTKVRVSTPYLNGSLVATHLPLMGIRGADYLRELYDGYISSIR